MRKDFSLRPVSQVLEKILPSYGLNARLAEWSLKAKWREIVGEQVAAHSQPIRLSFKRLVVMIDSPAWVQHLTFLKPELIEKLKRSLSGEPITEITFRVGSLSESTPALKPSSSIMPRPCLNAEEIALVEEYLRPLEDPALKERVRSLITKFFLGSQKQGS